MVCRAPYNNGQHHIVNCLHLVLKSKEAPNLYNVSVESNDKFQFLVQNIHKISPNYLMTTQITEIKNTK
jgi:hypothetical protein